MFCPNCGAQLPDNAAYCNYCGNQLQQYQQPQQYPQYPQYEQQVQPQQPQQYPQYQQQVQYQQPQQKKSKLPIILGAAGAVVVLLAVILLVSGGKDKENNGGGGDLYVPTQPATQATVDNSGWEQEETEPAPVQTTEAVEENKIPDNIVQPYTVENQKVSLKQVASFTEPVKLSFSSSMPVKRETVNEKAVDTLLSYEGKDLLGKGYHNYTYFGAGVTAAYIYDTEVPKCELVNVNTGEVYLADGAAKIEKISDRFYYVIYATEKTDNQEECFIYFTDRLLAMSPDEGDLLYKGYGKIFDMEKKKIIDSIQIDNGGTKMKACEDTICLEKNWNTFDFYDADGKQLGQTMEDTSIGTKYIIQETNDGVAIYDSKLNKLGAVKGAGPVDDESSTYDLVSDRYLEYRDDDYNVGIMTISGKKVLDAKYEFCNGSWNDYLIMYNEDDTASLLLGDGTELIAGGTYESIYKLDEYPAFKLQTKDDKDFLYLPNGKLVDITDAYESGSIYYMDVGEDYTTESYLLYQTGEWKTYTNAKTLGHGLLRTDEGIVDMFSGEVLLEGDYDYVYDTEEYIYIYTDNTWLVYQIEETN